MRKSHSKKVADKRKWRHDKEFKRKSDEIWNMAKFVSSSWLRKEIDRQFMTSFAGCCVGDLTPFHERPPLTYDMLLTTAKEMNRQMPMEIKMLKSRWNEPNPSPISYFYDWSGLKIKEIDIADF